jgi:hypothetical protein
MPPRRPPTTPPATAYRHNQTRLTNPSAGFADVNPLPPGLAVWRATPRPQNAMQPQSLLRFVNKDPSDA